MIKKINVLLIIIAIIGSLYFVITRDNDIVLILKDLSIIITINGLYLLKKIFKVKISEGINFLYILFIFIAHFLGVICELYNHIYWFDKFAHFLSGVVTSFVAIALIKKENKKNTLFFYILFILSFSLLIASAWEIFEYLASVFFGVDPQKVVTTGVHDTMGDIIIAGLASILCSLLYFYEYKYNKQLIVKSFENCL